MPSCILGRIRRLHHGTNSLVPTKFRQLIHADARNRLSAFWTPTQSKKKAVSGPGDEDGHDLLIRAGFLRQAQPGIFHTLPLGLRVLNKVESLIDKHMQSLGASKVSLSSLSSEHLWIKSGRLDARNSELFHLKDRKNARFLLAPTHEEEITTIVKHAVHSYKDLPLRLYQVSRKYRDEARPRQGLLRGREFIMKDLYTFDLTEEQAMTTYGAVQKAYKGFLDELNLPYLVAAADSGNMGGNHSHEYHFASPKGEDTIIKCGSCDMSMNEELYIGKHDPASTTSAMEHKVPYVSWVGRVLRKTDAKQASAEDKNRLAETSSQGSTQKSHERGTSEWAAQTAAIVQVYYPDGSELNIHAVKKLYPDLDTGSTIDEQWLQSSDWQPIHLHDPRVSHMSIGTSETQEAPFLLTKAREHDACPSCGSNALQLHKAVEIGHTFHLGSRYSKPLEATVQDDSNKLVQIEMGCHGVGVSRLVGATAALLADVKGLNWPIAIAPFTMVLVGTNSTPADELSELYDYVIRHTREIPRFDAVVDDRERPFGWKLSDADLIGYPFIVVLGKAWKERKAVELQIRRLGTKEEVRMEELPRKIAAYSKKL